LGRRRRKNFGHGFFRTGNMIGGREEEEMDKKFCRYHLLPGGGGEKGSPRSTPCCKGYPVSKEKKKG